MVVKLAPALLGLVLLAGCPSPQPEVDGGAEPGDGGPDAGVDGGAPVDGGQCGSQRLWCEGACAPCPDHATATVCAGPVCEASSCAAGFRPCAGLCAPDSSGCACAQGARPAASDWTTWAPLPVPPLASAYVPTSQLVVDAQTCLMWQRGVSATTLDWAGAKAYCQAARTDGYADWRLPTETELLTLVDRSRDSPAIDVTAFPNTPATVNNNWYWSGTPMARDATYVWIVGFLYGSTAPNLVLDKAYARCVR